VVRIQLGSSLESPADSEARRNRIARAVTRKLGDFESNTYPLVQNQSAVADTFIDLRLTG
jgi:hypothetical protein